MYIYILRSKWLSLVTLKCVALHAIFLKGQSMNFSFAELSLAKEIDLDLWTFDNFLWRETKSRIIMPHIPFSFFKIKVTFCLQRQPRRRDQSRTVLVCCSLGLRSSRRPVSPSPCGSRRWRGSSSTRTWKQEQLRQLEPSYAQPERK